MKRKLYFILFFIIFSGIILSAEDNPFQLVFIDAQTENELGAFPYNRAKYAEVINKISQYGPRFIVLKFFLDLPKDAGDSRLSQTLRSNNVILQARIDNNNIPSNPFPDRFYISNKNVKFKNDLFLRGNNGWIPLPIFSRYAMGIGFADIFPDNIIQSQPLIEKYKGHFVYSLPLLIMTKIFPHKSWKLDNNFFYFGNKKIKLDYRNCYRVNYPKKDNLSYVSFEDVLKGNISKQDFKNKIVIIGYDGDKMHKMNTPIGDIRAHRVFYYSLETLYNLLKE